MQDHFRVCAGLELVAATLQLWPQFLEVIDISIEYDPNCTIFIAHWVAAAGGQVDDR